MTHTIPPIEDVWKFIAKMANSFWSKMPRGTVYDLDFLESEGRMCYVKWTKKFDGKCRFITGLWYCLRNRFGYILTKAHREHGRMGSPPLDEDGEPDMTKLRDRQQPVRYKRLADLAFDRLTRREHFVVRALLQNPRLGRDRLCKKARMTPGQYKNTMRSLREKFSEVSTTTSWPW